MSDLRQTPRSEEPARIEQLRADARRSLTVNLAETISLSHKLLRVAKEARPVEDLPAMKATSGHTRDLADSEELDAEHDRGA